MRVWRAGLDDVPAVARLIFEFGEWWGNTAVREGEIRANVERVMAGDDGEFLLAAADDGAPQAVCQIRYRWSVWKSAHDAWLEDVFVREEARGSGLGRALVEAALEHARERGCRRIELDVNEDNAPALALYEACGFSTEPKPPGRTLFVGRPL